MRAAAVAVGATQFEVLTAAAFAEFAAADVDAAVVEAGLGGRHDATNVLDAPVVLLTNVGLDHTDVLGETREAIAREKLAVVRPARSPSSRTTSSHARPGRAGRLRRGARGGGRVPRHRVDGERSRSSCPAGSRSAARTRSGTARTTPRGSTGRCRAAAGRYTVVASILRDKDVDGMLERLARVGDR